MGVRSEEPTDPPPRAAGFVGLAVARYRNTEFPDVFLNRTDHQCSAKDLQPEASAVFLTYSLKHASILADWRRPRQHRYMDGLTLMNSNLCQCWTGKCYKSPSAVYCSNVQQNLSSRFNTGRKLDSVTRCHALTQCTMPTRISKYLPTEL